MCVKTGIRLIVCFVFFFNGFIYAEDTLIHPELLSPQALEEYENEGRTSFGISVGEEILYRTKAQFSYKVFEFNYRNEGGEGKENQQQSSLKWIWKNFEVGVGRGQPHIAKGMILGNTMMRFTSALGGQAGVRPSKIGIKSSFQYKELIKFGFYYNPFYLFVFKYDDHFVGVMEIKNKFWLGGIGFYLAEKPIYESWFDLKKNEIRFSTNISFCGLKFNHISSDILYNSRPWTFIGSTVALGKEFREIKTDSKWGSGLKKGNYGFLAGISYSDTPWKAGCISYSILGSQYHEKQLIVDLRYKKNPIEITLSLNQRSIMELRTRKSFPYVKDYEGDKKVIPKLNIKIKALKHLDLGYQLQADMVLPNSYAVLYRLDYEKEDDHIRLQVSQSNSGSGDLYFVRPLTLSSYAIRKAPKEKTTYIDLLYCKKLERFEIYVLVRTEGVNFGINYK